MTTKTSRKTRKPARVAPDTLPLADGKLDMVAMLIEALTMPGQMSQCYNRFHRYSFLNMVLVFMQTGRMEPLGTFNFWAKRMGRRIVSGPGSALFVNHPVFVPQRNEDGSPKIVDGKRVQKLVGFVPKPTVFQLSQTDGPELAMPELPEWSYAEALAALDITEVPFAHHDGNTQGYSTGRNLAVSPVAAAPMKTAMHEIAHIVLGHTAVDADGAPQFDYANHRGVAEFQAEAVALLVCNELAIEGFDASASRAYIQHWLGSHATDYVHHDDSIGDTALDVNDSTVRAIFSAVDKVLVAGRKSHYAKQAAAEADGAAPEVTRAA